MHDRSIRKPDGDSSDHIEAIGLVSVPAFVGFIGDILEPGPNAKSLVDVEFQPCIQVECTTKPGGGTCRCAKECTLPDPRIGSDPKPAGDAPSQMRINLQGRHPPGPIFGRLLPESLKVQS